MAVVDVVLLAVPVFLPLVVAVVDVFLPVVALVEVLPVDSLWEQETKNATPASNVMKEKTDFFIGLCKGAQTVQARAKPQA